MKSKIEFAIIFWAIFATEAQKWYSATVENQKHHPVPKTSYITGEPTYLPLTTMIKNHTKNKFSFLSKYKTTSTTPSPTVYNQKISKLNLQRHKLSTQFESDAEPLNINDEVTYWKRGEKSNRTRTSTFQINKTITNLNVIKKPRPNGGKGKYIRRCRTVKPRHKKQLNTNQTLQKRFLEVFEVVEFDHVACTSSSGLEGTCLPEFDCQSSEGIPMGSCADGYGTCCVTQFSCDDHSAATLGWFTNPGFPSPSTERLSCVLTLNKASADIKQIRLDFNNFELLPPNYGTCEQDQFVISGQNVNNMIPILCGVNTGQHVYVEVGDVDGPVTLSVQTVSSDTRLFSIKISQLTSSDDLAAPSGCLQYFKGPLGYLESFNFRDKSDISIARTRSYLNNLNYAMCIERATGTCSVTYTNTGDMQVVNYDSDGLPVIPPGQAGVEIFNCPTDWLLIAAVRLCGERLNDGSVLQDFALDAPVIDIGSGPLVVWFRSDGGYVGRGFKIQYQLNNC